MDLLQMDIHRRVNEFMHLSLSKCHKSISDMLSLFDPHDCNFAVLLIFVLHFFSAGDVYVYPQCTGLLVIFAVRSYVVRTGSTTRD